jgi:hypothetical protein
VNADPAAVQFPLDAFTCDERPEVLAGEQAASEYVIDLGPCATDLAIEQVLADGERPPVDQWAVLAGVVALTPPDIPDLDAVSQHP